MAADINLSELAVDRSRAGAANLSQRPHKRAWVSRIVLPAVVLASFAGLVVWAARDRWRKAVPVRVAPVVVHRGQVSMVGAPLFQAAGWVEPRPRPVFAAALTMGVVEQVFVVAGQDVQQGDPIANLIDADARLAVEQAKAVQELRTAELASAQANLEAALVRLAQPVHLQAELAESESLLAAVEADLAALPFLIASKQARLLYAEANLEGKLSADAAVAQRSRQQAKSDLDEARAEVKELEGRFARLEGQRQALDRRRQALDRQLELLVEETREAADAKAQVQAAEARLSQAKLDLKAAELALERTVIRAPIAGRVLEVIAQPGVRVSAVNSETSMAASTIASLYDPKMLQVRADVRLEHVPSVTVGQRVSIETPAARGAVEGFVLSATSLANVGKNTLEVKVALVGPPATLRPEMLVTATFFAPESNSPSKPSRQFQLLIRRELVIEKDGKAAVWIIGPDETSHLRSVVLGGQTRDGQVEVQDGLSPGDWLIVSDPTGLRPGAPVEVVSEQAAQAEQSPAHAPMESAASSSPEHEHGAR